MYGYIYITTNLINGKVYIGQHRHTEWDKSYIGSGTILEKAIKKYGKNNFKCELIEECQTEKELNEQEIFWIKFYRERKECYNVTRGGQGFAVTHSKETREKLSKSLKGRMIPKEARENMSKAHIGIPVSEESKLKISKALKGRTLSEEHRKKLSISHTGVPHPHSQEWKEKVSKANKGRKFTPEWIEKMSLSTRGEKHPNYGKHLSEETKRRISEAQKERNRIKKLKKEATEPRQTAD